MFVSVVVEPGGVDSATLISKLLTQFGYQKVQRTCWENMRVREDELAALKKDIDRVTDYYDNIRIYQFPIDGMFVITELKEKKWRRCRMSAKPADKQP